MSKLSYICNPEQVQKLEQAATANNGTYFFIRKFEEKGYFAYRRIDTKTGYYFVKVGLPKEVYSTLIASGRMDKLMNK